MCKVLSVCVSKKKGEQKKEMKKIECLINHGIKGDAHAGNWHRQISLLSKESINKIKNKIKNLEIIIKNGDFAENIITEGIKLKNLSIGTKLKIGKKVVLKITQIGKECHTNCLIKEKIGDCIMPKEGVFSIVINNGIIKKGDKIKIIDDV